MLVKRITADLVRGTIALTDKKPLTAPPCDQDGLTVDPPDIQAAAVARGVAALERSRRGHEAVRLGLQDPALHQGEVPAGEVRGGGPQAPRGVQPAAGLGLRGLQRPQGKRRVAPRLSLHLRARLEGGMRHAQRIENPLLEELPERLPADLGDDMAQERVAGIAVRPARARLEVELGTGVLRQQGLGENRLDQPAVHEVERIKVGISRTCASSGREA